MARLIFKCKYDHQECHKAQPKLDEKGNIILPEKTINGEWKHCVFCGRNMTLGNCYGTCAIVND